MPKSHRRSATTNQYRIIGGQWRSRTLDFVDADGLRPTPNRVRETLFNWLQPQLPGSRCLDAFAGAGALGTEALSRGAAHVDFIELNRAASQQIQSNLLRLQAPPGNAKDNSNVGAYESVHCADALTFAPPSQPYDIIFLDPPFAQNLLPQILEHIQQPGFTHQQTLLYVETEISLSLATLPTLQWQKQKTAGQVNYGLATLI